MPFYLSPYEIIKKSVVSSTSHDYGIIKNPSSWYGDNQACNNMTNAVDWCEYV